MFLSHCLLTLTLVLGDTHIDRKVSVKEVVFDSPVAELVWLAPENRVVLARTHNGNDSMFRLPQPSYSFACRSLISEREQW